MYCIKCKKEIIDNAKFCINCGTKVDAENNVENEKSIQEEVQKVVNELDLKEPKTEPQKFISNVTKCCNCGFDIQEDEKFCINCGADVGYKRQNSYQHDIYITNCEGSKMSRLQEELAKLYKDNKFLAYIDKYAMLLVFIFPIYSLMCRFSTFDAITDILVQGYSIWFYGYYTAMTVLFYKRKYPIIIGALLMRLLNTVIILVRGHYFLTNAVYIAIYVTLIIVFYKAFSKTNDYRKLMKKINLEKKVCANCGEIVNCKNTYCSKCGSKID